MSVNRYLVTSDLVVQHEQGMWVRYSDHAAALAAERAKFAAENERLRKALSEVCAELTDHRGGWPHWAEAPGRVQGALNIIRAAFVSDSTKQAAEDAAGGKK
jgi:hypothetical protein